MEMINEKQEWNWDGQTNKQINSKQDDGQTDRYIETAECQTDEQSDLPRNGDCKSSLFFFDK